MKQLTAFTKKELLEQLRSGRLVMLGGMCCIFGIMNPAIAKLTPWLLEILSDQLSENGMYVTEIEVDALASWAQFFKNMPVLLIVFIVIFSGILTAECQRGTLVNVITKGMKRWKILISKLLVMSGIWTAGCLITFGITYGYNAYFWDNRVAQNLLFAVFGYYLVGLWLLSVVLPASVVLKSAPGVTLCVGTAFAASYLLGLLPALREYVPTFILRSNELLAGAIDFSQCLAAVGIALLLTALNTALAVLFFNHIPRC